MNMEMNSTSKITAESVKSAGQSIVTDADSRATDAVSTLTLVQQARLSSQKRAVNAAVSAYGKNSAQAAAAQQAFAVTQSAHAKLNVLHAKVSTPQPAVPSEGWVLHGHVFDAGLNPQQSYTVFLVDAQKNYLSQYGFSYTDSKGYFLIRNEGAAAGASAPKQEAKPPASPAEKATGQSSAEQAPAAPPASSGSPDIFLQIADASGNPVLLSQTAFTPVTGQAVYQAVTLPAGAGALGDPPAQIRDVALPPDIAKDQAPKRK